jgi:tetratricopeptide (TPR) repeat protein
VPQVAQELAVDLVVEGSVARVGDRVRVTAQLIDARSDEHIWARSYDRTLRDVLALQGEMATAIAGELRGAITPRQQGRLSQRRPIDPAVYDVYLRGRQAWNLRTPEGFDNAIRYFAEAVKKDPEFALGFAGLADAYSLQANLPSDPGGVGAAMANAKAAAERALALDEGLAEAHTSLGAVLFFGERNFDGADRAFRRALELNAGYPTAHQWIAILLAERGLDAEATGHAQQAVSLDPLSGTMHQTLGLVHYFGRRYALAAAEARRALDLGPGLALPRVILAKALILQGDWKAAIDVCEQAPSPRSPDLLAAMSLAHLRAGDRQRAEAILREVTSREPLPVAALAQYHAAAGNASAALDMLDRAVGSKAGLPPLTVEPLFDSLRADARFTALLGRAKG